MERDIPFLEAYLRYSLMPLRYEPREASGDAPVLGLVEWWNRFSGELLGLQRGETMTKLVRSGWCVNTSRSSWGPETYRHYTLDEFEAKLSDPEFAAFMSAAE